MNDLYGKSVIKLALMYASIIGVISLFFSVNLFWAATNEISRALDRQERQLEQRGFRQPVIDALRFEQYKDAKESIIGKLVFANLIIVTAGGMGSYILARKTLQPIKDAHDAQQRFTSDASHELRTPLTAIISDTEVALRDKKLTKQQATEVLASNLDEVKAMAVLTDNLLTLTKNEKIAKENFSKIDLKKLALQVTNKYKTEAANKKIKLTVTVEKDMKVFAHQPSLGQILGILIENAIKYSQSDSIVEIGAKKSRKYGTIFVKDSGPGISPVQLGHVFDRFYQADTARSKKMGYGLGLSIAQRLAHAQGMQIKAQSKLGEGSTFSIEVSLAQ
ncbi:HAMP domain-containing histidine kinase [Candidatus Saccharibacteria bacterium]|nr:HAMP domain-containing histidine kinase [Candidatus Saccharibacteria bacterium]